MRTLTTPTCSALSILLLLATSASGETRYVSSEGSAESPFTCWKTAARDIASALDVANDGDQIVVAREKAPKTRAGESKPPAKPAMKPIDLGKDRFKVEVNPVDEVPGGLYGVGSYRIAGQVPDAKTLYAWRLKKTAPDGNLELVGRVPAHFPRVTTFRVVNFSRLGKRITARIEYQLPGAILARGLQSVYLRANLPQRGGQSMLPTGEYDVEIVFDRGKGGDPGFPQHIKPMGCRFVVPATGISAELKKLAEAAIAIKPGPFARLKGSEQTPTGLDLSRILKLTGEEKDRAAFTKDHRFFDVGVNALVKAKKTWALCSLLDHPNVDAKCYAASGLGRLADPDSVPVLLAAAKRNDYIVGGSENATLHLIYRSMLKGGLEKITGLQLTPKGLTVTTRTTYDPKRQNAPPSKPQIIRSDDQPRHTVFIENVDFPKVDAWLQVVYLHQRTQPLKPALLKEILVESPPVTLTVLPRARNEQDQRGPEGLHPFQAASRGPIPRPAFPRPRLRPG